MKNIKYFERCAEGARHNGDAWIAGVELSKSGKTVYFNGRALKKGQGVSGNHYDLETGEEYWISGIKQRGTNRHWAGSGRIMVEQDAVAELLRVRGEKTLDESIFVEIPNLPPADVARLSALENE